jgi:hypothetical protein
MILECLLRWVMRLDIAHQKSRDQNTGDCGSSGPDEIPTSEPWNSIRQYFGHSVFISDRFLREKYYLTTFDTICEMGQGGQTLMLWQAMLHECVELISVRMAAELLNCAHGFNPEGCVSSENG